MQDSVKTYLITTALAFIVLLLSGPQLSAQVKLPVRATAILKPPYSVYLNDFTAPGAENLLINLQFNDFNEPSWDVALRITVESQDGRIQTRKGFRPIAPITLTPGVPSRLSGADLAEYLDTRNVTIEGIDPLDFRAGGKLPEGMYSFCVEVVDYSSGIALSLPSCANAWLMLQEPPRIVSPMCEAAIVPQNPQRLTFSWQSLNIRNPSGMEEIVYKLKIYEVTAEDQDPAYAIANGQAMQVYESEEISNTTYIYGAGEPQLDLGKKYAYTIQALSTGGRNVFKNNGFSEVCWFSYGYPIGGRLALQSPAVDAPFQKAQRPVLSWSAPNNLLSGQQYLYQLKIVKIEQGQTPEQAIENNFAWYETETKSVSSNKSWEQLVEQDLEPDYRYAWKVYAWSGEQMIASSETRTFFGPAVIDKFTAGGLEVVVKSTKNRDLQKLSGVALVHLDNDDATPAVEVEFQDIQLVERGGFQVMMGGEILISDSNVKEIALSPADEKNPAAKMIVEQFRISKKGIEVKGANQIPLPWAIDSPGKPMLLTRSDWFLYENFQPSGNGGIGQVQQFAFLDPAGFNIELSTDSEINLSKGAYKLKLKGNILLPEEVVGMKAAQVQIPFERINDLSYFELGDIRLENFINLAAATGLEIRPRKAVFDLSDEQSPGHFESEKNWKGLYFQEYFVNIGKKLDESSQLKQDQDVFFKFPDDNSKNKAFIDGSGISMLAQVNFEEGQEMKLNTFPGEFNALHLEIEGGSIKESWLDGKIRASFISKLKMLDYRVPLAANGFQPAYMKALEGIKVSLNEQDETRKVQVFIQQGYFEENERLSLSVDVDYPSVFETTLTNLNNLKLWGNGNIGFGEPDKIIPISRQFTGTFDNTHTIKIDSVGFGYAQGFYAFSIRAGILMDIDAVSPNGGAPRLALASGQQIDESSDNAAPAQGWMAQTQASQTEDKPKQSAVINRVPIVYKMGPLDIKASMQSGEYDPKWGSFFDLYGSAIMKFPKRLNNSIELIGRWGKVDETDYIFIKLNVNGHNPQEIPVGVQGLAIPGTSLQINKMSAAFYKNMKMDYGLDLGKAKATEPAEDNFESNSIRELGYSPDGSIGHGGSLHFVFGDLATKGQNYITEVGGDISFNEGGELSFLELNGSFFYKNTPANGRGSSVNSNLILRGRFIRDVKEDLWFVQGAYENGKKKSPYTIENAIGSFEMRRGDWRVDIGKEVKPVGVGLKKFPTLKGYGYLSITNKKATLGMGVSYFVDLSPGWTDLEFGKYRPVVAATATIDVLAAIGYEDEVYLDQFDGKFHLYGNLTIHYDTIAKKGSIKIASATLTGKGGYKRDEGTYGAVKGEGCFIGMCKSFEIGSSHLLN